MTRSEAELLAKAMLLDAWLRGHIKTRGEFERLFHSLDPRPRRWDDSWPGIALGTALIVAVLVAWVWVLR